MSDVLVSVENLSKKFCRSLKKSLWYGVQDMASEMVGSCNERKLRPDEFWAVNDVSFELKRGECLGLIGRNGAGKTTLLKMLNGLIKPDKGQVKMRGRVGGLIALGAGFNPILSGRENIYVNASVLGLGKREIDKKMDEIIDFAELDEFIDSPVQNYSSGMQVRLGFAIATALEPDILLLDEVLAVGDIRFRAKCYNRINDMCDSCAVLMVSHNTEDIFRLCTCVNLMEHGKTVFLGTTADGIKRYLKSATLGGGSKPLVVEGDYLDMRVTDITSASGHLSGSSGVITIHAHITAKTTSNETELIWCLLDSDGRNVCVSQSIPLKLINNKSYSLSSVLSELRLCSGVYQLGANIIRVKKNAYNNEAIEKKWDLLASFRSLGQIIWKSEKLIKFGSSIFMDSKSTYSEVI